MRFGAAPLQLLVARLLLTWLQARVRLHSSMLPALHRLLAARLHHMGPQRLSATAHCLAQLGCSMGAQVRDLG
jgi:hypothetical protein